MNFTTTPRVSAVSKELLDQIIQATNSGIDVAIPLDPRVLTTTHRISVPRLLKVHLNIPPDHVSIRGHPYSPFGGTLIYRGSRKPQLSGRYIGTAAVNVALSLSAPYKTLNDPTWEKFVEELHLSKSGIIICNLTQFSTDKLTEGNFDYYVQRDNSLLILK